MSAVEEKPISRAQERAAIRRERDGSGPVRGMWSVRPNPGAASGFALFGEVLTTGLLVSLVGLAVVTLPAGLAAGIRHLRRYILAEDSRPALFWADVRRALLPGAVVGTLAVLITVVLLIDIDLARSGLLPGGPAVLALGWAGLALVALSLLVATGEWTPGLGWSGALRRIPSAVRADVMGAVYLIAAAAFVVLVTEALFPLFVPAIGCAALAVVAIPARPRRQRAGQ